MPEFILDRGSPQAAHEFNSLDQFTQGYIEAMFFTDASDPDDGELENATFADLHPDSLARIIAECAQFQNAHAALLAQAYERDYDAAQAGRDYWFTRNGHGVGFWDRDALKPHSAEYEALTDEMVANRDNSKAWSAALAKRKALSAKSIGEQLSAAARYSERNLYLGDDDKVHVS